MTILGLHILDIIVVVLYMAAILVIGAVVSRRQRNVEEFFLANRGIGKVYQFFLNFGEAINADNAVGVAREVYRQGVGGMWINFIILFVTPFYWFVTMLFRRVRLLTVGDYFEERFESRFLAGAFALYVVLYSILRMALVYVVVGKTMMALAPIPAAELNPGQLRSVQEFAEYQELGALRSRGETLNQAQAARLRELSDREKTGMLKSFFSHIDTVPLYLVFAFVVGGYTIMGGLRAAVLSDSLQSLLIIIFSLILLPVGLSRVGGFEGLHAKVPGHRFQVFGGDLASEYAWYSILALTLAQLVATMANPNNMSLMGSARNERDARFGAISGAFGKRLLMIAWALTGMLAFAMYGAAVQDPDLIWGKLTRDLLAPGLVGLMLAGILAAAMSTLSALAISYAALFINNLYRPFFADRSERHYMNVGRVVIAVVILLGILVALYVNDVLTLLKYAIPIPACFGAAIWLGFMWRGVTRTAVILQVAASVLIMAVVPFTFQGWEKARRFAPFLAQTSARSVALKMQAAAEDVAAGRASAVGEILLKTRVLEPVGIFYDRVGRLNPEDPKSPLIGHGRFYAEMWILSRFGFDFSNVSKAALTATYLFFDALHPFLILIVVSLFTKPVSRSRLDGFFAKIHTPIQQTPERDRETVRAGQANPSQWDGEKIIRAVNWEILKPARIDYYGFLGTCLLVGLVLALLYGVFTLL